MMIRALLPSKNSLVHLSQMTRRRKSHQTSATRCQPASFFFPRMEREMTSSGGGGKIMVGLLPHFYGAFS